MTTIINLNTTPILPPNYIYIGRGSIYGNPYSHLPGTTAAFLVSNRTESVMKYRQWLRNCPGLVANIRTELKGKTLGCYCKPKICHGDILVRVAEGGEP